MVFSLSFTVYVFSSVLLLSDVNVRLRLLRIVVEFEELMLGSWSFIVRSIVQLSSDDEFVENDVEFVKFLRSVASGVEFVKFLLCVSVAIYRF